jgi:hypothetical protein
MSNEYELGTMLRLVLLEFQDLELQRWQQCIYVPVEGPLSEAGALRPSPQSGRLQNTQMKPGATERNPSRLPADNLAPKQRLAISHLDS